MHIIRISMLVVVFSGVGQGADAQKAAIDPEMVLAGFEKRVDVIFRTESGKPLVRAKKQKPLGPGRGNYVRAYSHSIMAFAARCLYLGEKLDEANAAIVENAQHYLDNPRDINDRDSFHWHADIVMRLIEMYGTNGTRHRGRINEATEAVALRPIWLYAKMCSWLGKAEVENSQTWDIYGSENHHSMDFTVNWHFSKLAKDRPEYRTRAYDDDATAEEHYRAWNDYFVAYCRERARKGICVEMRSDGYNATLIKGFYNFYDFGDPKVRRLAGMLLDLYFAYWAEEQIDGHMGGGGSRIKGSNAFHQNRNHGNAPLAWFYFGIGQQPTLSGHEVNAALSGYRPPAVVADIALDVEGRGRYEVRQRVQGLGEQGRSDPMVSIASKHPSRLRTDGGGILRYSFCDPAFIVGTPMVEARPLSDWVAISSQSRWQGVVFAGEHDARIVPLVRPKDNRVVMNAQWSVQSKGCLITQKQATHRGGAEMNVWMSDKGLSTPVEQDGIVFVEAEGAWAAIRVPVGGFTWKEGSYTYKAETGSTRTTPPGRIMVLQGKYPPVILEVMAKRDLVSFDAFKASVKKCSSVMDGPILKYETIYGDQLTLDTSYKQTPTINGQPVNYAPEKVYDSPFLNADHDSGIVTISKGDRVKELDFCK